MGKRIISQRRGKGSPKFRAPSHKYKAELMHPKSSLEDTIVAKVIDIEHDPARAAPIIKVRFEDGEQQYLVATEGISVGADVMCGPDAEIKSGNILPLYKIPEGVQVCNLEGRPMDGGKFVRSTGTYATVVAHEEDRTSVQMASGALKWFNPNCRATIGIVAGGGRTEKPFLKAGKRFYKMKVRATRYPRVRAVAMNPRDHPFGGGNRQHPSRGTTVSRNAPPGAKVGHIAARRTGKKR
ncbi:MAG: 50S ribosomal protein L2 [Methanosarcinaceae archaeon]|nr:50S ribosomal protein L2 [Methanosarcinaceae archaeon]